jgi:short subunit dehydrogenase-like uncharacterized protein
MMDWMIYGANGYSGHLIAVEAARLGLRPILAGRSAQVEAIGRELGLPVRRFDVNDSAAACSALSGVGLVLNCAGPFSRTAAAMIGACLESGAHYLDITGDYAVFEHARSLHGAARKKGVVLCPGVGFDVIPTDCLALALKRALPDAQRLELGFDTRSGLSPGTLKSMIENLPDGGRIRHERELVTVPNAYRTRRIDFGHGRKWAMTIPWGDVSTAFASTGIPNIAVYFPMPRLASRVMRWTDWSRGMFGWKWLQRVLVAKVERSVTGPSAEQRATLRTAVWGEVGNARGEIRTGRIETANGYALTVDGALAVVRWLQERAMAGGAASRVEGGYYTPATLIGPELVEQLPGSGKIHIS